MTRRIGVVLLFGLLALSGCGRYHHYNHYTESVVVPLPLPGVRVVGYTAGYGMYGGIAVPSGHGAGMASH